MSVQKSRAGFKFMQTLAPSVYRRLEVLARKRSITVQEYIRVIIIPEHLGLDGRIMISSEKVSK